MNYKTQKTFLRLTTVLISTAGLSLVLTFYIAFKNINNIIVAWGEAEKVTVYFDSEASSQNIEIAKQKIEAMKDVLSVNLITKEAAIQEFKAQMGGYVKDIKKDIDLVQIIPSYLEVTMKSGDSLEETIQKINKLSKKIESLDFVEEVFYGSIWIEKYAKIIEYLSSMAGFIGFILMCTTYFVISNLIKTNLFQRAKEIEVLEMIGATKSFIRKPFLIEGVLMSSIAGSLAVMIIGLVIYFINIKFASQISFFKLESVFKFINFQEVSVFMLISMGIGLGASYLNLIRFRWNSER